MAKELSSYQMEVSRNNLNLERKSDGTPVTEVDKASEQRFRDALARAYPEDLVLGEEGGDDSEDGRPRWVIDPIDGTRKFMRGLPFWGICLAFEEDGDVRVGVVAVPGAGLIYAAVDGQGAECNGKTVVVEEPAALDRSFVTMPPRTCFEDEGFVKDFDVVQRAIEHDPGFLDAYSYGLVADGRIHGLLSCGDRWWDIAAPVCLVREAGGRFTDLRGGSPGEGKVNFAGAPGFHEKILELLHS